MKDKLKHATTRSVALTFAVLLTVGIFSDRPVISQTSPRLSLAERQARQDWLQADLSLDNSAYAATRSAINKQIKSGIKPTTLVQKYELKGKDVGDSQKIFRWAYAIFREQRSISAPDINALIRASSMLDRNLRPGAYDWIRLRYIIASMGQLEQPDSLIPVGRRLLKQKYDDPEVMLRLVRQLSGSQDKENRRLALALAKQQLQQDPTDPYKQWAVSDATNSYLSFGGPITFKANKQIVAEKEKTLRLLPANSEHRKRLIAAIVVYRLHFDANGKKLHHTLAEINQAIANTDLK